MNSKMLKDTYVCSFKASRHLCSNLTLLYTCSRASPWIVSLGKALMMPLTAAVPGSPHTLPSRQALSHWGDEVPPTLRKKSFTKSMGVILYLKIQAIRL